MSIISKYRTTKEAIKELQQQLEALERNEELKKEMEFEEKLQSLMAEYGKSLRDINALLDPQSQNTNTSTQSRSTRRTRKTKRYTNPHTNEVIETKGGNHKQLKEWKATYGGSTVEGWVVLID